MDRCFAGTIAGLAALAALGCAHGSGKSASAPRSRAPVELVVENKSVSDLTVFVIHDGRTDRLDRIEGVRKKLVTIPARMVGVLGDLRLIGEREGARAGFAGRIATQSVTPQTCQRLEWTIEARLEQSTLGVFPKERCE